VASGFGVSAWSAHSAAKDLRCVREASHLRSVWEAFICGACGRLPLGASCISDAPPQTQKPALAHTELGARQRAFDVCGSR